MEKLKWLGLILLIFVIVNLLFLDWQFYSLSKKFAGLALPEMDRYTGLIPKGKLPLPSPALKITDCPDSCLAKITELETEIAAITPMVREVQKTQTVVSQSSAVKEGC